MGTILFILFLTFNTIGSCYSLCSPGFQPVNITRKVDSQELCLEIDECVMDGLICGEKGACINLNGSYECRCPAGFTNFGQNQGRCVKLDCDQYRNQSTVGQRLPALERIFSGIIQNCVNLDGSGGATLAGETRLEELVNVTDSLQDLQSKEQNSNEVTKLLSSIEEAFRLIAPQLKEPLTKIKTNHTEAEIRVRRDKTPPTGPVSLTNENAKLDTTWEAATGIDSYPGFAFAILLSYKSLKLLDKNSTDQLSSNVVTVSVGNPNTTYLPQPANLTFTHLEPNDEAQQSCVFWSEEKGAWSEQGCMSVVSNSTHTVCSCSHLSSFALLRQIHEKKKRGQLSSVMWVGSFMAIAAVVLSLLVTLWCRSNSRKRNVGLAMTNRP